ncbi:MAG: hypothetical protein ACLQNV_20765, partial [Steroidobacteraceae bacterium]
ARGVVVSSKVSLMETKVSATPREDGDGGKPLASAALRYDRADRRDREVVEASRVIEFERILMKAFGVHETRRVP